MKLPIMQPQGEAPNTSDFTSLQTTWAQILEPFLKQAMIGKTIPIGTVLMWAPTVVPPKFLLVDGQVLLQKLYPDLFLAIGTTYNTGGEAAGSFRLPVDPGLAFSCVIKYLP